MSSNEQIGPTWHSIEWKKIVVWALELLGHCNGRHVVATFITSHTVYILQFFLNKILWFLMCFKEQQLKAIYMISKWRGTPNITKCNSFFKITGNNCNYFYFEGLCALCLFLVFFFCFAISYQFYLALRMYRMMHLLSLPSHYFSSQESHHLI